MRVTDPLAEIVRALKHHEPERIILSGSRAQGDADEHSYYALIIIKRTDKSNRYLSQQDERP